MSKTVVFIHGAWLTPSSWAGFASEFKLRGYDTLAPAWPYLDRPIAELRESPADELKSLGIAEIVDHYASIVDALDEPPLLVGHSFGGLIVQLLLNQGLGTAGVALDPAPPRGVFPTSVEIRNSAAVLFKPFGWRKVHTMSEATFRASFGNALPESEQKAAYDTYIVPAPGRIFFQAAFGRANGINWSSKTRPPLLITTASEDKTVSPALIRNIYKKQSKAGSQTKLIELPGFCHFLMIQSGWGAIATQVIDWAETVQ